jgi:hypothetical protein
MNVKQILLSTVTLVLSVYILLATAYAQEVKTSVTPSNSSAGTVPVTSPTPVDYQLPYPGMLPDNPLYFLKVFRDNLTAFFLSKPIDKANFDLLQSDKNVQASYLLVTQQQGKTLLAFQTFSQAQDYFEQAILQAQSAKKQGYSTKDLANNLSNANQKHEQILQALAQTTHQESSETVQKEHDRAEALAKEIKSLQQ